MNTTVAGDQPSHVCSVPYCCNTPEDTTTALHRGTLFFFRVFGVFYYIFWDIKEQSSGVFDINSQTIYRALALELYFEVYYSLLQ